MKSAALAIALTLIAAAAFAQRPGGGGGGAAGRAGGAAGGAAAVGGSATAPAGSGRQRAAAPGNGPVFTPGAGVVLPGVAAPPTAITPQGTAVAPGVTATPGVVPSGASSTATTPFQPGIGQPLTPVQPARPMTAGPQLGAGLGSQPGGFPTQAGPQNSTSAAGLSGSGTVTGSAATTIAPGGIGPATSATTNATSSPASASAGARATRPPVASPILIDAPAESASASIASANTAAIPDSAIGVVIAGMMLSDVVDLDRERSCITLRSLDGTTASYRVASGDPHRTVAVGDQVVIEMVRPLVASGPEAPSASPRMAGPSGTLHADEAATGPTAPSEGSNTSTIISPLHRPEARLSTTGERCARSRY